nr:putative ribonuclease H-like domain-containing protein [Tanacetum cinerariifolium]
MLWDALTDKLQTFDLHVKANGLKQNGTPLEEFWIVIQGIWGEIERRDPNPMTCPTDIAAYNKIRSDNGGEFVNTSMKEFCQKGGIIHQTSCAHTPEQNEVSERKNHFLLEITCALMIESHVPKYFWPEALATATYLVNRLPTRPLGLKTPLQVLSKFHKLPSILTLEPRVFGCSVFVHIPKMERFKIDPCAEKYVLVGYEINQHGYRCYSSSKRHIFTTMNYDFLETEYFYNIRHTG